MSESGAHPAPGASQRAGVPEGLVPAVVHLVNTGPVLLGAYAIAELTAVDAVVDFLAARRATRISATCWPGCSPDAVRPCVPRSYTPSTFGMIASFSRLRSSSVFETGTSANGGQMSSRFSPASFSRLRLSVTCAAVPTSRLLPFPSGV
jgi:hypothetical protein